MEDGPEVRFTESMVYHRTDAVRYSKYGIEMMTVYRSLRFGLYEEL